MHIKSTIATAAITLGAAAHAYINVAILGFDVPNTPITTYFLSYQRNFFGDYALQPTTNQSNAIDFNVLLSGTLQSTSGMYVNVIPIQDYPGPESPGGVTYANSTTSGTAYVSANNHDDILSAGPDFATWVICVSQYGATVEYGSSEFNVTMYNSQTPFPCYDVTFSAYNVAATTSISSTSVAPLTSLVTETIDVTTTVARVSTATGVATASGYVTPSPVSTISGFTTVVMTPPSYYSSVATVATSVADTTSPGISSIVTHTVQGPTITESYTVTVQPACSASVSSYLMSATSVASIIVSEGPASTSPSSLVPIDSTSLVGTSTIAASGITTLSTVYATSTVDLSTATASGVLSSAASSPSSSACPIILEGKSYQYPHLIIPVNESSPDTVYGTQYSPIISATNPAVGTIFNFDIPTSYAGSTCSLIFALPTLAQMDTSSYTMKGAGHLSFYSLVGSATQDTTWNNAPAVVKELAASSITSGSAAFVVAEGPCAAGDTVAYEVLATEDLSLTYFQDFSPCPIGLYVVMS